jgi:hypothetical protein
MGKYCAEQYATQAGTVMPVALLVAAADSSRPLEASAAQPTYTVGEETGADKVVDVEVEVVVVVVTVVVLREADRVVDEAELPAKLETTVVVEIDMLAAAVEVERGTKLVLNPVVTLTLVVVVEDDARLEDVVALDIGTDVEVVFETPVVEVDPAGEGENEVDEELLLDVKEVERVLPVVVVLGFIVEDVGVAMIDAERLKVLGTDQDALLEDNIDEARLEGPVVVQEATLLLPPLVDGILDVDIALEVDVVVELYIVEAEVEVDIVLDVDPDVELRLVVVAAVVEFAKSANPVLPGDVEVVTGGVVQLEKPVDKLVLLLHVDG